MRRPGPEDDRLKDCRAKGQCAPDVYESSHRVPQFLYFGFLDTLRCQKVTYLNIDHRYPDEKIQRWPNREPERDVSLTFVVRLRVRRADRCAAAPPPARGAPWSYPGPWRRGGRCGVWHTGARRPRPRLFRARPLAARRGVVSARAARGVRDRKVETN
jgi:hypothetical protein